MGAVVANHLWPAAVGGGFVGVDIFFVISGFLITSHLLREARGGRIGLAEFWARRARRLLPASLLVLALSAAATLLIIPATMWRLVMRQIIASTLYVQNWALAADAQDYFASSNSPSPVTHYWSLSAEEQFYLVWPLLLVLGLVAARRRPHTRHAWWTGILGLVTLASALASVWLTRTDPQAAYFVTPTRAWEFGTGGLLALAADARATDARATATASAAARVGVAGLGWLAMLGSVLVMDETTPIPGWLAWLPVTGTALVLWAGTGSDRAPSALVRLPPVQWLGDISYSLYLWHWPPIVLLPYLTGHPLTAGERLGLLVGACVVAHLSTRFVEIPVRQAGWLRRARPRRTYLAALAAMAVVLGVGSGAGYAVRDRLAVAQHELASAARGDDPCFAARAIANDCPDPHTLRYPESSLLTITNTANSTDWGRTCQQLPEDSTPLECQFGVPAEQASLRVALVGDSHASQWAGALDTLAVEHRWNVVMLTKSSCPANSDPGFLAPWRPQQAEGCREWTRQVLARVAADPTIDVVVMSALARMYGAGPGGYQQTWRQLTDAGKSVVVIADVPFMDVGDIPACVAAADADDPCTTPVSSALREDPMTAGVALTGSPQVVGVDLTRFFCDRRVCHAVIGGVVAFGDNGHIHNYFSRTLAPYLYQAARPVLG